MSYLNLNTNRNTEKRNENASSTTNEQENLNTAIDMDLVKEKETNRQGQKISLTINNIRNVDIGNSVIPSVQVESPETCIDTEQFDRTGWKNKVLKEFFGKKILTIMRLEDNAFRPRSPGQEQQQQLPNYVIQQPSPGQQPSTYPGQQATTYPGQPPSMYPGQQLSTYPGQQPPTYPGQQPPTYPQQPPEYGQQPQPPMYTRQQWRQDPQAQPQQTMWTQHNQDQGQGYGGVGGYGPPLEYDPRTRNSFVALVMGLVLFMLLATAAFLVLVLAIPELKEFFQTAGWMLLMPSMFVLILVNYAMVCSPCTRRPPCNIIMLILTTISMSIITAKISCHFRTEIILYAVLATGAAVFVCVLLACSKFDFTSWMLYVIVISVAFSVLAMIVLTTMLLTGTMMKPLILIMLVIGTLIQSVMELRHNKNTRCVYEIVSDYYGGHCD